MGRDIQYSVLSTHRHNGSSISAMVMYGGEWYKSETQKPEERAQYDCAVVTYSTPYSTQLLYYSILRIYLRIYRIGQSTWCNYCTYSKRVRIPSFSTCASFTYVHTVLYDVVLYIYISLLQSPSATLEVRDTNPRIETTTTCIRIPWYLRAVLFPVLLICTSTIRTDQQDPKHHSTSTNSIYIYGKEYFWVPYRYICTKCRVYHSVLRST